MIKFVTAACCLLFFFPGLFCQSYQRLHQSSIVIDTHNDVLSTATMKGLNIESDLSGKTHSDIARFKEGGIDVQVFSIFCDDRFGKDTAFKFANIEMDSLYAIIKRNPDKMMLVKTPAELKKAVRQKKLGCMMGVEGGHMIEDRLDYLDSLYVRGARYMTLTWNNSTSWASSARDESQHTVVNAKPGLNDFGKLVVQRMNALGMLVDLSHVGEQTFWDAIHITTRPVLVSHSCVYHLCPVFRNLNDEQIKAVGKNGGVIHLNFYSGFLDSTYLQRKTAFLQQHPVQLDSLKKLARPSYEIEAWISKQYPQQAAALRPSLSLLMDHLDYIVKIIGTDHVGIGSDFDGIESAPKELNDVTDLPLLTRAMMARGYSKKDIKKILGGNFIRIFRANTLNN